MRLQALQHVFLVPHRVKNSSPTFFPGSIAAPLVPFPPFVCLPLWPGLAFIAFREGQLIMRRLQGLFACFVTLCNNFLQCMRAPFVYRQRSLLSFLPVMRMRARVCV